MIEFNHKVRDHCHISSKYRGSSHWNCNINSKISKKLPVIFHNLRGYDRNLIFKELSKLDCKISVIPNGLEKCMSFTLNNNIVFIDSMLFMNSCLDKLAKNLRDKDFKYLTEKTSDKKLKLVKKKGICLMSILTVSKNLKKTNYLILTIFYFIKKDYGISEKEYEKARRV